MRECPACGFANPPDSNFCGQCGVRLTPPTGDTTHIFPVIDDETTRAEFDIDDATTALAPGTALLLATRGLGGARYLLDQPETTAGRSASCDILLDDITVSRRHATFSLQDDGSVVITDHGSLNGTYVNRELIDEPTVLKRGDEIQIGKFRMVLLVNDRGTN